MGSICIESYKWKGQFWESSLIVIDNITVCWSWPFGYLYRLLYLYTNGQRYGITTTKWHLREFDRYLLFLVVCLCSIAERNTVEISSIHYVTKVNGQTQSVLSGDRWDSTEGKKGEFRGSHLKWSLPSHYHFDAFMQRGVSVKTIDISLNFSRGSCHKICQSKYCSELSGCRQMAILSEK